MYSSKTVCVRPSRYNTFKYRIVILLFSHIRGGRSESHTRAVSGVGGRNALGAAGGHQGTEPPPKWRYRRDTGFRVVRGPWNCDRITRTRSKCIITPSLWNAPLVEISGSSARGDGEEDSAHSPPPFSRERDKKKKKAKE